MFLICKVTSCDLVVRGSYDITSEFPLVIIIHPAKFDGYRICVREEISFFVCHVTSRDSESHVTLWVSFLCHY